MTSHQCCNLMCWNRDECLTFEFQETDHNNFTLLKLFITTNLGGLFIFKLCITYWYTDDTKQAKSAHLTRVEVSRTKLHPVILLGPVVHYLNWKKKTTFKTTSYYRSIKSSCVKELTCRPNLDIQLFLTTINRFTCTPSWHVIQLSCRFTSSLGTSLANCDSNFY